MTTSKDLKRLVRARMTRTGESYTAARAQLVRKRASSPGRAAPPVPNYAALAGMADEKVRAKTGRDWAGWVEVLDRHDATAMKHREIAKLLGKTYGTPDWWTQTVTVGYERIKGKRAIGQRVDGTYEATKSRTFDVPVSRLFDAWAKPAFRKKWIGGEPITVRTSSRAKYVRLRHADGSTVVAGFTAKGKSKSSVAVQHAGLPSRAAADARKAYWAERLDALRDALA
jgi:uncharacterized protein YndB with AHSA1/START domain